MTKKICFMTGKGCDLIHGIHTYYFRKEKLVSCMFHKPIGWKRNAKFYKSLKKIK